MATPAVFVFIAEGCGACHDYMPKFERYAAAAKAAGAPFPIGVYDLAQENPRVQEFAEKLGVRATPTTIVVTSDGKLHRHVGSLPVAQIKSVLSSVR